MLFFPSFSARLTVFWKRQLDKIRRFSEKAQKVVLTKALGFIEICVYFSNPIWTLEVPVLY